MDRSLDRYMPWIVGGGAVLLGGGLAYWLYSSLIQWPPSQAQQNAIVLSLQQAYSSSQGGSITTEDQQNVIDAVNRAPSIYQQQMQAAGITPTVSGYQQWMMGFQYAIYNPSGQDSSQGQA